MRRAQRRAGACAAAIAAVALLAAGCGGGSGSSNSQQTLPKVPPAKQSTTGNGSTASGSGAKTGECVAVAESSGLDHALLAHIVLAGAHLTKLRATPAGAQFYYVSAAVSGSGTKHLLATWVTRDLNGKKPIYSVDANAALVSLFGAASQANQTLSADTPGSVRSRECVDGTNAAPAAPAPAGGNSGGASGQ